MGKHKITVQPKGGFHFSDVETYEKYLKKQSDVKNLEPKDIVLRIGGDTKNVTTFLYNPFTGGYFMEWKD